MHLKMSSAKWQPFCPGGDDLYWILLRLITAWHYFPCLPFHRHRLTDTRAWISNHINKSPVGFSTTVKPLV